MPSTTREFPLTEEMKQLLNVTRMYAKGKTLFLDNTKAKPIECPYIADDPEKTIKGLRQALIDIHEFDEKHIDKFARLFADLMLKLAEESASAPEDDGSDGSHIIFTNTVRISHLLNQ